MAQNQGSSKYNLLLIAAAIVLLVGFVFWSIFFRSDHQSKKVVQQPVPTVQPTIKATPAPAATPDTSPSEPTPTPKPLPSLGDSDTSVKEDLSALDSNLVSVLVNDELLRKFVRAVLALSDGNIVQNYRPVNSPSGALLVDDAGQIGDEHQFTISADNFARYNKYLQILLEIKPHSAARLYRYYYPLLQEAYEELGLPEKSFNTVMLKAIDNMLSQPSISGYPYYADAAVSEKLHQPSVMYLYTDPRLEKLSGVEKLKMRMGPANAKKFEAWIKKMQVELQGMRF